MIKIEGVYHANRLQSLKFIKKVTNLPGVTHMTWEADQQTKPSLGSYYPWQPSFAFF
jgi:hypothetical protein